MPHNKQRQRSGNELRHPLSFVKSPSGRLLMPRDITGCQAQPLEVPSVPYTQGGNWLDEPMACTAAHILEEAKKHHRKRSPQGKGKSQNSRCTRRYLPLNIVVRPVADEMNQQQRSLDGDFNGSHSEAAMVHPLDSRDEEMVEVNVSRDIHTPALSLEQPCNIGGSSSASSPIRTVARCFRNSDRQSSDHFGRVLAPDTPECEYGLSYRMRQLKRARCSEIFCISKMQHFTVYAAHCISK